MSEGAGRWLEFELEAGVAERVVRAARRLGLTVETLAMPRFRVKVADAMQAFEFGQQSKKPAHSSARRRRR